MAALKTNMALTLVEREKITDSSLKIQSIRASLHEIDPTKIPEYDELQSCLKSADTNLRLAYDRNRRRTSP
jgi:hypothetical protein